jgi:hypothetical protein
MPGLPALLCSPRRAAPAAEEAHRFTTVSSTSAAASAVNAGAPGATVCVADGTYGKLTLNASKAAPGVTIRAEHPTDSVTVRVRTKARAQSAASRRSRSA